jgi:hypothetical protein
MKTYARINNGVVVEIIQPLVIDGSEAPIVDRFHPDIVATLVDASNVAGITVGWTYDGKNFAAPAGPSLDDIKADQKALIDEAYQAAVQQDVSFTTAASATQTFQADKASQDILLETKSVYSDLGSVPDGFYWKAKDNTRVPFTLVDLKGLAATMLAQGWTAFQKRDTLKAQIDAATTVDAVQAINW